MKAFAAFLAASTFALNVAKAHDKKQQKKAGVTVASVTVAASKALPDAPAPKVDRKAQRRTEVRLLNGQVKKETNIVRKKNVVRVP